MLTHQNAISDKVQSLVTAVIENIQTK